MAAVDLRGLVARADQAMASIEDQYLDEVTGYLRQAQRDLERELRRRYPDAQAEIKTKGRAFAEARARVLNEEIERQLQAFDLTQQGFTQEQIHTMLTEAVSTQTTQALEMLDTFEPGLGNQLATTGTAVNTRAVGMVAQNAAQRLRRHSDELIPRMKQVVASALIRGEGVPKAAARLRQETGLLRYQAERIIRTEVIQAGDEARQAAFAERGIQYVQRIATQDARVCPYCAARAGKVYKIGEAPAALHPNDRCFNVPWKPEWVELGLVDNEWVKNHQKDAIARMEKATGGKPKHGKAPFERANDLPVPQAVWTPSGGFTKFGNDLIKGGGGGGSALPVPVGVAASADGGVVSVPNAPVLSTDELHARLMMDFPTESFTAEERELFNQYFLNGIDMNRLLRAGTLADNDKLRSLVEQLDEALARRALKQDVTLYRGFSLPVEQLPSDPAKLVGTILDDAGFQSTSISREVSEEFLVGGPGKQRIMLEVRAKAGNRGTYLVGANDDIDELEMLLPRGSKFRVAAASEEQGVWRLTVDIVDDAARVADDVADAGASLRQAVSTGIRNEEKVGVTDVSRVVFNDGTEAIVRQTPSAQEELSDLIARRLGYDDLVPATVKEGDRLYQEVVPGQTASDILRADFTSREEFFQRQPRLQRFLNGDQGRRAGFFDYITGQGDRHAANWIVDEARDRMFLIDHNVSFFNKTISPFAQRWADEVGDVAEWRRLRAAVEELEQEFSQRGLNREYRQMLERIDYVIENGRMNPEVVLKNSGVLSDDGDIL